ncbi:FtsW/RodA/SpoVE family cell cycle protein [uncultured Eubacterium sp.]|uniref:FtsW/RodA/SpoVE family cell cycle protein n=1 Tax=uncultured Eubacterium sp. TaxID=165185 RepID=UPI000EBB25DA|nr:putative peptidoglycan glycosyltransferase FtsW [uncultured Eubacterium sp.]HAH17963.1 cell division protein [Eubacterium sp.]
MSRDDYNNDVSRIRQGSYFDISLFIAIVFLVGFGLLMVYSTSSYNAMRKYGDPGFYFKKQLVAFGLGFLCMAVTIFIDYRILKNWYGFILFVSLIVMAMVRTSIGLDVNGARRWIKVGPISIQPSEIVKIAVIISLATILSRSARALNDLGSYAVLLGIICAICFYVKQISNNLSAAIIIAGISFIMIMVAAPSKPTFLTIGVIIVAGAILVAVLSSGTSFRSDRFQAWHNPEKYSQSGGYQILQGLYAIGSGGFFGKGLGHSVQKQGFVPEPQNDMVFTIICEELGLFGGAAVIVLFIFMLHRFYIIARNADDLFGSLLVIGVMAHIAIQVILNIAVATNTIPNTGVTLPFLSYGGTSVVFLMIEMGMVLSVSRKIRVFKR